MRRALLAGLAIAVMAPAAQAARNDLVLNPNGFGRHTYASWKAQEGQSDTGGAANQALYLQKQTATADPVAAIAFVAGLEGEEASVIQSLEWERRGDSHCTERAPHWQIGLWDDQGEPDRVVLGCQAAVHTPGGAPGWVRDSFSAQAIAAAFGAQGAEMDDEIRNLVIVLDEGPDRGPGFAYLDNIKVNDKTWTYAGDNGQ